MKKAPVLYNSRTLALTSLSKPPAAMTKQELLAELEKRTSIEHKFLQVEQNTHYVQAELELHQLELEIQNRELQEAFAAVQSLNQKYIDLYDTSPVGYATLNQQGQFTELNLHLAKLLKQERRKLRGKNFLFFIAQNFRDTFLNYLAMAKPGPLTRLELGLRINGEENVVVELHGNCVDLGDENLEVRIALVDVAGRKHT